MDTGSIKDEDAWEYVKYEEEQASLNTDKMKKML